MRILATSSDRPIDSVPLPATADMMLQVRRGGSYASLDTDSAGGYVIRAASPIEANGDRTSRVLIALYPVPEQLSELANTVQRSYTQYANLVQLRQPLKSTFMLILTFVVLLSLFAAVYGAFFAAQRLVQPVQDLIAGTRAVARGDYDTQLPLPSRDELGFLVTSFNDMTKRLARARLETRRSQQAVEAERAGLAVILARLSTGVVSLEPDMTVRTANQAASAILRVDMESAIGKQIRRVDQRFALLRAISRRRQAASRQRRPRLARTDRLVVRGRQTRADVRVHGAARTTSAPTRASSSCSTTSRRCCRRSATPPGARSRGAWPTRSRIR